MTEMTSVGDDFKNMINNLDLDNLSWLDENDNLWKGWTYSPKKNRYYFDDIGSKSLYNLWNSKFLGQLDK